MNQFPLRSSGILVVHQDALLCAGLVAALRQHATFDVFVDDADRGASAPIEVIVTDYANAMRLSDPAERAARGLAGSRILVVTANDREADIRRAIEAGIDGYLLLGGPIDELVEAVTAVCGGTRYLGRSVAHRMADSLCHVSLTSREAQVLQLVAMGESNKAIARHLSIEVGTVKSHLSAIMTKLGAKSRTHAAGIATARGLVDEPAAPKSASFERRPPFIPSRPPQAWAINASRVAA